MPVTTGPLVGRDRVLARVRHAVSALGEGTGGCVVVEGPAGIGKSRLLTAGTDAAHAAGIAVATARPTELDRIIPAGALLSALRSAEPPVVDEATTAALTERGSNRFWLLNWLGERIEEFAMRRPLLVALDDAHWSDELTALALRTLVPELASAPVLWLVARRTPQPRSPSREAIDWLLAEDTVGAVRLRLGELSADEVAKFCALVLGAVPDDTVLDLAQRSGGNPFLLEQLLTTLLGEGRVLVEDYTATIVESGLPVSFLGAVEHRLRDLTPTGRRLLDVASVIGRKFTLHEAAGLAGVPAVQMLSAVDEAVRLGLLVDSGSEFSFGHDLIREAVYQSLSGPVRYALHREAATVLRQEGRGAAEVAEHVVRSARRGDQRAVAVLREAAEEIAPKAPGTAADLLLRALELLADDDPGRERVLADVVRLLVSVGRLVQARELAGDALRRGLAPENEAAILLGLAEALKHSGKDSEAVRVTTRALDRPDVPQAARAHLLAIRAHALLYVNDVAAADEAGTVAAQVGAATGEDAAVVFGTVARTVVAMYRGRLEEAIRLGRDAVQIADRTGGAAKQRYPSLWLGRALVTADRFTEADAMFEIGQREAERTGTAWSQPLWHFYRAELRLAAGRLDDAQAEAEAGLAVTERLSAEALSVPLLGMLAELARRRDQLPTATALLERARGRLAAGIGAMPEDIDWTSALVREACGDPAAALDVLAGTYESFPDRLLLLARDPWAGPELVRIALAGDARDWARATAEALARLADMNPGVSSIAGAAAHAEGLLNRDPNTLRRAVRIYRDSPRPLARASAMEDAGRLARAVGRRSDAVDLLNEALETYARCGALRDQARALRELRSLGVRRRALAPSRAAKVGWESLTEAELKVVRLVSQGLTNRATANRLFLSPHTVDTHLRHAFAKLGVSSRVELARRVLEREGAAG